MQLLIGTRNKGKRIEIADVLSDIDIECVGPEVFSIDIDPEETQDTFEGNAIEKCQFYYDASGGTPTLADDSGIIVEALESELGIHTRRWGAGATATDQEWIDYFLDVLSTKENKRVRFVCVLCYIDNSGNKHLFEGSCNGVITKTLEAEYLPGLPISGCFKPDGYDKVFSALSVEQKGEISHRGKAVHMFKDFLL